MEGRYKQLVQSVFMSSVSYLNTVDCVTSFSENLKKKEDSYIWHHKIKQKLGNNRK